MASPSEVQFPEENLLATAAEDAGFFLTRPGDTLKGGRYKIIRRLSVHIAKTIVSNVADGVEELYLRGFIHADIRADNILIANIATPSIKKNIEIEPPVVDGTIKLNGVEYPILRSQPLPPAVTWDITPYITELLSINVCDLGSALRVDRPKPLGDIGAFALRAPENSSRRMRERDRYLGYWMFGIRTSHRPDSLPTSTHSRLDQSLLLLQYALTGGTLSKEVVGQSRVKDQYFDHEGVLVNSNSDPYPCQSIKQLLSEHCPELEEKRINAAANFITYCLRLNPRERPTIDELLDHSWLAMVCMGCLDHDD